MNTVKIDPVDFSYIVEKVVSSGEYEMISTAILDMADEYNIPEDRIKRYLTPNLLRKLQVEAEEEGMLKKSSTAMMTF